MKAKLLALITALLLTYTISAQKPDISKPILQKSDVERFIKNFNSIKNDFEALHVDFKPESDYQASLENLRNAEEVNKVLQKYGYAGFVDFSTKAWAITASYASIKMGSGSNPEMEQLMKQVDENPNMTPEQKKQAKKQMMAAMESMQKAFSSSANKEDIETVRPFIKKLEAVFEEPPL